MSRIVLSIRAICEEEFRAVCILSCLSDDSFEWRGGGVERTIGERKNLNTATVRYIPSVEGKRGATLLKNRRTHRVQSPVCLRKSGPHHPNHPLTTSEGGDWRARGGGGGAQDGNKYKHDV